MQPNWADITTALATALIAFGTIFSAIFLYKNLQFLNIDSKRKDEEIELLKKKNEFDYQEKKAAIQPYFEMVDKYRLSVIGLLFHCKNIGKRASNVIVENINNKDFGFPERQNFNDKIIGEGSIIEIGLLRHKISEPLNVIFSFDLLYTDDLNNQYKQILTWNNHNTSLSKAMEISKYSTKGNK